MRRLRFVAPIVLMAFFGTACFGSFNLTRKLWSWNKGLGNKWVSQLVFLVAIIIPVYELATFIDAIILNTIEFWTGSNPVAHAETKLEDGRLVTLDRDAEGNVTVRIGDEVRTIVNNGDQMVMYGNNGELVATAITTASGGLAINDTSGVREYSGEALASAAANPKILVDVVTAGGVCAAR